MRTPIEERGKVFMRTGSNWTVFLLKSLPLVLYLAMPIAMSCALPGHSQSGLKMVSSFHHFHVQNKVIGFILPIEVPPTVEFPLKKFHNPLLKAKIGVHPAFTFAQKHPHSPAF